MARKKAIGRAFGEAARYDEEAHVQREVADGLARHIAGLPLPPDPNVLEIGCGTGFLTAALRNEGVSGTWIVTDLSPTMTARCRAAMGEIARFHYAAMDGERPCLAPDARFDLICSSLAFQWFHDLEAGIARLCEMLAPGGHLVFTTMADGSFGEWRVAHRTCGLEAAIPDYPALATLGTLAPPGHDAEVFDFRLHPHFADARAFIDHLRGIGAHVPRDGVRPLAPGALRRVMRAFERAGAAATYHIACCTFRKPA